MAGTNHASIPAPLSPWPVVILARPQLGENIGMTARAMLNCGLTQLRLTAPRDGWPNPAAVSASAGATAVIENAAVFPDLRTALGDLQYVYATTATARRQVKPVVGLGEAVADILARTARGERVGVLFGPERSGLENEDISLADAILTIPLNPAFSSLNLSQAVLLVAHGIWDGLRRAAAAGGEGAPPESDLAPRAELFNFFDRLERMLVISGFLFPPEKRPMMVRNLRNLFHRARLRTHEVQTLHGIMASLAETEPKAFDKPVDPSIVPSLPRAGDDHA
jgi:tRNA/rRNA methyltransferase